MIFDKNCNVCLHISAVCSLCIYHIRDLRSIRRHLDLDSANCLRMIWCLAVLISVILFCLGLQKLTSPSSNVFPTVWLLWSQRHHHLLAVFHILTSPAGRRLQRTNLSGELPLEKELQPSKAEDANSWRRTETKERGPTTTTTRSPTQLPTMLSYFPRINWPNKSYENTPPLINTRRPSFSILRDSHNYSKITKAGIHMGKTGGRWATVCSDLESFLFHVQPSLD